MAVEHGNLIWCAERATHHADWTAFSPPLSHSGQIRLESVRDSLIKIRDRLEEIRLAADKGDAYAVMRILEEEFEFGKS